VTATAVLFALYVRNTFRGRWKLDSLHATRDEAAAAALNVRAAHVWVTTVPAPADETDPTKNPIGGDDHE
jgi:hypothetical protein